MASLFFVVELGEIVWENIYFFWIVLYNNLLQDSDPLLLFIVSVIW